MIYHELEAITTLTVYNNSLLTPDGILSGREYRRLKRKNRRK